MARKGKAASQGLRSYRQKMVMDDAVFCGESRLMEVVYGYRFPSHRGRVKIGYSSRGLTRVAEQSTAFPEKPELLFLIRDKNARRIEAAFHAALSDRQSDVMGTEWFDVTWKEILAVSPHLRRATGTECRRRAIKWGSTAALAAICAIMYPLIIATISGIGQNVAFERILESVETYFGAIASLDFKMALDMARGMMQYANVVGLPILAWVLAAALCFAPLFLPWMFTRRQAH